MSEIRRKPALDDDLRGERGKKVRNWGQIGAIAGIVGALAACAALYPIIKSSSKPEYHRIFDGPIAAIAIHEKSWDIRGFAPGDVTSTASEITYQYAGHYTDSERGDWNPKNEMCTIKLHANPSATFPYPGDSGFVFVQPGTPKRQQGTVLYNPSLDDIYQTRLTYEFVPAPCWPVGEGMQFPHDFREYLIRP